MFQSAIILGVTYFFFFKVHLHHFCLGEKKSHNNIEVNYNNLSALLFMNTVPCISVYSVQMHNERVFPIQVSKLCLNEVAEIPQRNSFVIFYNI